MISPERARRRLPTRAERRVTYALKVVALIAISIYLLVDVLQFFAAIRVTGLLIVMSLLVAYLVYPLVRRLNARLPVIVSILVVYLLFAAVLAVAILTIAPALVNDTENFIKAVPALAAKFQHELLYPTNWVTKKIPFDERLYVAELPSQFGSLFQKYGATYVSQGLAVVLSSLSLVLSFVIVPVLAAYMLLDASNVRRQILGLFPPRRRPKVDTLIDELDGVIGGFIRGQLIDGAIVGVMIFVMLTIMHVPYALLIGVAAGILNFIPYAGAVIGFVPSVLLALAYNGPGNALIVAALFAVIQQVDGNFVAPRVLKDNVGLSPLYIIIAILLGSELFGLFGTFLAVPIAAMLRVFREQLLPQAVPPVEAPPELTKKPRANEPVKAK
jgi:predicted PurR-regulated permease PerM